MTDQTEAKKPLYRRMYDWVLHWAYTPYALPALIILSFAESSFFPIPPDVMLLPLCLAPFQAIQFNPLWGASILLAWIVGRPLTICTGGADG